MRYLLIAVLLLAGCHTETIIEKQPEVKEAFEVYTFIEVPEDQDVVKEYRQNMSVNFRFTSLEDIREEARLSGIVKFDEVYGLSRSVGSRCLVYVEEPGGYWDVFRLYIIGHEMLHCWGWGPHGEGGS